MLVEWIISICARLIVSYARASHFLEFVMDGLICGNGSARRAQNSPSGPEHSARLDDYGSQIQGQKKPKEGLVSEPWPTATKVNNRGCQRTQGRSVTGRQAFPPLTPCRSRSKADMKCAASSGRALQRVSMPVSSQGISHDPVLG